MSKFLINYPKKINKNFYAKGLKNLKTKFGLPKKIIYCTNCVISNQRPSSTVEFKNQNKNFKLGLSILKKIIKNNFYDMEFPKSRNPEELLICLKYFPHTFL